MALLDVSSVLLDPMFVDRLVCTRNTQIIGDNGIAVDKTMALSFAGVVTNDKGDVLIRNEEGARVEGSITIHTKFILRMAGGNYDADLVTWGRNRYTVTQVSDYSHFGRGFVAASCELLPIGEGING